MSDHQQQPPSPQRKWRPEPIEKPILPSALQNRKDVLEIQEHGVEELAERLERRMNSVLAGYSQLNEMAVNIPDSLEGFATELSGCARKIASDTLALGLDDKHVASKNEFSRLDLENAYRSIREVHGAHMELSRDLHFQEGIYKPVSSRSQAKQHTVRTVPSSHMSKQSRVIGQMEQKQPFFGKPQQLLSSDNGFIPIPSFRLNYETSTALEGTNNATSNENSLKDEKQKVKIGNKAPLVRGVRSQKAHVAFGGGFRGEKNTEETTQKKPVKKRKTKRLKKRSSSKENQASSNDGVASQKSNVSTNANLSEEARTPSLPPSLPPPLPPPSPPPSGPTEQTIYRVLPVSERVLRRHVEDDQHHIDLHQLHVEVSKQPSSASLRSDQSSSSVTSDHVPDDSEESEPPSNESISVEVGGGVDGSVDRIVNVSRQVVEDEASTPTVHFRDVDGETERESSPLAYYQSNNFDEDMVIFAAGGDLNEQLDDCAHSDHHHPNMRSKRLLPPHSPGYSLLELQGQKETFTELEQSSLVTKLVQASHYVEECEVAPQHTASVTTSSTSDRLSEQELHTLTLILLANMADEVNRSRIPSHTPATPLSIQQASTDIHPSHLTAIAAREQIQEEEEDDDDDVSSDLASLVRCLVTEQRQNVATQKQLLDHILSEKQTASIATPSQASQVTLPPHHLAISEPPPSDLMRSAESDALQTLKSVDFSQREEDGYSSDEDHQEEVSGGVGSFPADLNIPSNGDGPIQNSKVRSLKSSGAAADGQSKKGGFNSNWGQLLHEGPNFAPLVDPNDAQPLTTGPSANGPTN